LSHIKKAYEKPEDFLENIRTLYFNLQGRNMKILPIQMTKSYRTKRK